ncbi:MAG: thioredoxin family protein [Candidatus Saccharimonas sp.]|nr:thioredoxin family protein [Candidatus Saccharimonas sp.]
MNKKVLIIAAIIIGLLLVGGGVAAYNSNQNNKKEQEKMAMEKKAEEESMMKKDAAAMEKDKMAKEGDSMEKDTTMVKQGSYVTRSDYDIDPSKYTDSKKVYFFHASWCPICQGIDKALNADMSKIPAGVTFIKTDFDNSSDLRQKYGVTTQYTFVQVDSNGNETAQWSATSLEKAIDGIES